MPIAHKAEVREARGDRLELQGFQAAPNLPLTLHLLQLNAIRTPE